MNDLPSLTEMALEARAFALIDNTSPAVFERMLTASIYALVQK